jgi:2,3-bisphosphoglycerate-independent phosphoglycerate mutase
MSSPLRPVLIVVRDGWGVSEAREGNAVALARTPRHDELWARFPTGCVSASEHSVGLPAGQMGNSEVGHLNMGAGRVVFQDFARIENDLHEGRFGEVAGLVEAMDRAEERDRAVHLMGLCSDGGVHSHEGHLKALLELARDRGVEEVYVHAITDGRDVSPTSGVESLERISAWIREIGVGQIATVSGRYYAMDRDKRWDRIQKAYDAIVHGRGPTTRDPVEHVRQGYAEKVTDEFVIPAVVVGEDGKPVCSFRAGDQILAFNFRADRMRQICHALASHDFDGFDRGSQRVWELAGMTRYDTTIPFRGIAYPPKFVADHLCEVVGRTGRTQFKCAETEKYAHVTFFWNGGVEAPCPHEERLLIPSPRVATYDLQPEMHSAKVAAGVRARLSSHDDVLLVVNLANADMVGHTGDLDAAVAAVEAVDDAVGQMVEAMLAKGGAVIVTADHGNCEQMIDPDSGGAHTAHTTNPVHAIVCGAGLEGRKVYEGATLADVAPTALELMGLEAPAAMTARSFLVS